MSSKILMAFVPGEITFDDKYLISPNKEKETVGEV